NISTAKQSAVQNVDSNDSHLLRWYNSFEISLNARLPHGVRISGGPSIDRVITNSCSAATNDPNLLLFCDGSKNNIPWVTNFKLFGAVPLPWYGVTGSFALQALAGQPLGTAPLQYGVFTAGTGFTQPNGISTNYLVSRTTRYGVTCNGPACTPGALVVPNLTAASVTIPIVAPGTEFTPRTNQLD